MSQELLYTSAPRGLKSGSRGFCMVLCSEGMPTPLATALESLSAYKPIFPPGDSREKENPVNRMHVIVSAMGRRLNVLSRVAGCGLDYSGRPNKLAHHVVVEPQDRCAAGPAWLFTQSGVMKAEWSGEPRQVAASRTLPSGQATGGICHAWKAATGDAGWGGVLAESLLGKSNRIAYLIHDPGFDPFPLIAESVLLLPPERRWEATFATYATNLPAGAVCNWRCIPSDSPQVHQSRRHVNALRIDLTQRMGEAEGGELAHLARTGRLPAAGTSDANRHEAAAPPAVPNAPTNACPTPDLASGSPLAEIGQRRLVARKPRPKRLGNWGTAVTVLIVAVVAAVAAMELGPKGGQVAGRPVRPAPMQDRETQRSTKPALSEPSLPPPTVTADSPPPPVESGAPAPEQSALAAMPGASADPVRSDNQQSNAVEGATEAQPQAPPSEVEFDGRTEWVSIEANGFKKAVPIKLPVEPVVRVLWPVTKTSEVIPRDATVHVTRVSDVSFEFSKQDFDGEPLEFGTVELTAGEFTFGGETHLEKWFPDLNGYIFQILDRSGECVYQLGIAGKSSIPNVEDFNKSYSTPVGHIVKSTPPARDPQWQFPFPLLGASADTSSPAKNKPAPLVITVASLQLNDRKKPLLFATNSTSFDGISLSVNFGERRELSCQEFEGLLDGFSKSGASLKKTTRVPEESFPRLAVSWLGNEAPHSLVFALRLEPFIGKLQASVSSDLNSATRAIDSFCKKVSANVPNVTNYKPNELFTTKGRERLKEIIEICHTLKEKTASPNPTDMLSQNPPIEPLVAAITTINSLIDDSELAEELLKNLADAKISRLRVHYYVADATVPDPKPEEAIEIVLIDIDQEKDNKPNDSEVGDSLGDRDPDAAPVSTEGSGGQP